MDPFAPRLENLPETFPVFPLTGALLLPQGRLPLNVFEPRYLAMVDSALAHGRMFGMIQPDPQRPRGPNGAGLYRVGCLGRLSSFSETDDGRFLITLSGLIRFRLIEELPMQRGFRRVRGEFSPYTADLDEPAEQQSAFEREHLLAVLRAYFTRRRFEANWEAIAEMPDDALVVTLCMVCPFDPAEKQALLEAGTPGERAGALLALLQIDTHESFDDDEDGSQGRSRAS